MTDASAPPREYYRHVRQPLVDLIEPLPSTVLEVGCGTGNTLAHLKALGVQTTHGIEVNPQVASEARDRVDHLLVGDIEALELPYAPESLDCVVLGDVLEHLRDPWRVTARLAACLRPGGQVVASIPNVRFYGVWLPLVLRGRWEYRDEGIMDRTHLRFFTRHSMRALFEGAGLQVVSIGSHHGPRRALANALTLGLCGDLLALQHYIKARKQ